MRCWRDEDDQSPHASFRHSALDFNIEDFGGSSSPIDVCVVGNSRGPHKLFFFPRRHVFFALPSVSVHHKIHISGGVFQHFDMTHAYSISVVILRPLLSARALIRAKPGFPGIAVQEATTPGLCHPCPLLRDGPGESGVSFHTRPLSASVIGQ